MTVDRAAKAIAWYRTPLDPRDLKRLHAKSDLLGGVQTLGYLGCYGATLSLALFSSLHWEWWATALLTFLHGTVASFLINAMHELTHGTVFRTKALNAFFARVVSFLGWLHPGVFQASHARHHRYTLHQPDDQEVVLPIRLMFRHFLLTGFVNIPWMRGSLVGAWQFALGRFSGEWHLVLFPENAPERRKPIVRWARFLLIGHLGILAFSVLTGHWLLPVLVSMTPLYGGWLHWLCNNTQHIGLQDDVPDFRLCCRTFHLNPLARFLYWHMNFHIEHHMYAAVPCYRLGHLHHLIAHDLPPCPRGLASTWREIWEIEKRQDSEPGYRYVAPLPGTR